MSVKVLAGKNLAVQVDPSGGATVWTDLNVQSFDYTPEVDSATYASSQTSGYKDSTSGIYGCSGSFEVLAAPDGTNAALLTAIPLDGRISVQVFNTNTHTTPNFAAVTIHIKSIGKPTKTADNMVKRTVSFDVCGVWTEA